MIELGTICITNILLFSSSELVTEILISVTRIFKAGHNINIKIERWQDL